MFGCSYGYTVKQFLARSSFCNLCLLVLNMLASSLPSSISVVF